MDFMVIDCHFFLVLELSCPGLDLDFFTVVFIPPLDTAMHGVELYQRFSSALLNFFIQVCLPDQQKVQLSSAVLGHLLAPHLAQLPYSRLHHQLPPLQGLHPKSSDIEPVLDGAANTFLKYLVIDNFIR